MFEACQLNRRGRPTWRKEEAGCLRRQHARYADRKRGRKEVSKYSRRALSSLQNAEPIAYCDAVSVGWHIIAQSDRFGPIRKNCTTGGAATRKQKGAAVWVAIKIGMFEWNGMGSSHYQPGLCSGTSRSNRGSKKSPDWRNWSWMHAILRYNVLLQYLRNIYNSTKFVLQTFNQRLFSNSSPAMYFDYFESCFVI